MVTKRPARIDPLDACLAATTIQFNHQLDQAAETALLFIEFQETLRSNVLASADEDGQITEAGKAALLIWLDRAWAALWQTWLEGDPARDIKGFLARRRECAQVAADAHRMLHAYYFEPFRELEEQDLFGGVMPAPNAPPFDRQVGAVLDAADARLVGSPPVTWSQRLWTHQNGTLNAMTARIQKAVMEKESAWELARALESFLKVDARWTRWSRSRLFDMVPADRVVSSAGLLRKPRTILPGMAPPTRGVAYDALRLARTELQAVHNMATDLFMQAAPWVEKERVMRSPSATACPTHCDAVVGPPGGEGTVYEKGTVSLPLHPLCLCYKLAELMQRDVFVGNVRGWLRGENTFLDGYRPLMQQDHALMAAFEALLAKGAQTMLPI